MSEPHNPLALPNPVEQELPEEIHNRAYEVMSSELDHWQIVGPQQDVGTKREFFTATRLPDAQGYAPVAIERQPGFTASIHYQHFVSRAYAVSYVQFNGLRAVLNDPEIRKAIKALPDAQPAPPANSDGNSTD